MPRQLTVVFTVNDEKAFEEENARLRAMFSSSEGKPYTITAWSNDDEVNRHMLLLDAINMGEDVDVLSGIVTSDCIGTYASLEEYMADNK